MFPIEDFPHNQIIKKASVKIETLDDDIRILLTSFTKKYNGYRLKQTEAALKELQALSNLISQHIYDYYVDKEDQEVEIEATPITPKEVKEIVEEIKEEQNPAPKPVQKSEPTPAPAPDPSPVVTPDPALVTPPVVEEPEPTNKNEKALFLLLKEGKTSGITKAMLKEKGFNTDLASIRGCRVGEYILYKEFSETTYHLKKS